MRKIETARSSCHCPGPKVLRQEGHHPFAPSSPCDCHKLTADATLHAHAWGVGGRRAPG